MRLAGLVVLPRGLAAQLERRGLDLPLEWAPREMNAEADALADGRAEGFSPSRRVEINLRDPPWLVLPRLLQTGEAFYSAAQKRSLPSSSSETGKGWREIGSETVSRGEQEACSV